MKGEIFYGLLLLLYPKPFRNRFGREMMRLYRDCYPVTGAASLWMDILKDLVIAVPREWRREFFRDDSAIDYTGLGDAFMCSIVVGALLLGWGWMGATVASGHGVTSSNTLFGGPEAGFLFTLKTLAVAFLVGILSTLVAARSGRIDTTCSQLITYERNTARFSR